LTEHHHEFRRRFG